MCRVWTGFFATVLLAGVVEGGTPLLTPRLTLAPIWVQNAGEEAAPQPSTSPPTTSGYGITGDWFGHRGRLEESHITFEGFALLDVTRNFRGGLDTENFAVRHLLDLHLLIDADAMGLRGGMGFIDFQWHDQTGNADTVAGDLQAYDNLEGPRFVAIEQLWYRQDLGGNFRLKIGRIDGNADAALEDAAAIDVFSKMEHGIEFLHSAASYAPPVFVMPTYPNPAPGVELFYGTGEGFYAGAGVFYSNARQTFLNISGHPEVAFRSTGGVFLIGEAGYRWKWAGLPGHAGAGGWYHTGNFPSTRRTGEFHRGAGGGYVLIDQTLYLEEAEGEVVRDLGMFFTAGASDSSASPMNQSLTLGVAAAGWVPARPDDVVGVMTSWVQLPAPPEAALLQSFEWATEAFYKFQLTQWAAVKPAFTYIATPSGRFPDAALLTVRVEVSF